MNYFWTIVIIQSLALIYFYYVIKYCKKSSNLNRVDFRNEMLEKYVLQKLEHDKSVKLLSCELKHLLMQCQQVPQIANSEGYSDMLNGLYEYEKLLESNIVVDIGNDIANTILKQKLLYASKNNIIFEIQGYFHEGLLLSPVELCSLLGNLIDNSIEAAIKVNNVEEKKIILSMNRYNAFLFLEIKNSYKGLPVIENNRFITRKKNRPNHDIALISINKLVDKYNGAIENTFKNHIFKSTVMILRVYDFHV